MCDLGIRARPDCVCVSVSDRGHGRRLRGGAETDGAEGWRGNFLQTLLEPDPKRGHVPIRPDEPRESVQMHLPSTVSAAPRLAQDGGMILAFSHFIVNQTFSLSLSLVRSHLLSI